MNDTDTRTDHTFERGDGIGNTGNNIGGTASDLLGMILTHQAAQFQPGDDALIDSIGQRVRLQLMQIDPRTTSPASVAADMASVGASIASANVVTVTDTQGKWRPMLPGVERKTLMRTSADDVAIMLRMQAGSVLPAHHHGADESCVVISGRLRIGPDLIVGSGGFHWVAQGTNHEPIVAEVETLVYLRGALDAHA